MIVRYVLIIGVTLCIVTLVLLLKQGEPATATGVAVGSLPVKFWEEKAFYDGLEEIDTRKRGESYVGAVVPHHLIAGGIIADIFARVPQTAHTIILIGPNHYEVGSAPVISSQKNWDTVFGIIEADQGLLERLEKKRLLAFSDKVMIEEHSTQGMMPYVKYFAPEAKVVPLILSATMSREELESLAAALKGEIEKGAIVIAAVDFSHHLPGAEAEKRDAVTLEALRTKNIDWLLRLNTEYLDSPQSIALLLMLMNLTGHDTFALEHHSNSGELLRDSSIEVTSYIAGTFR